MKKWLVLVWLLIPVVLVSYHFGPGQEALAWRDADARRDEAVALESAGNWEQAVDAYQQALNSLPPFDDGDQASVLSRDQLRLAQIRARFQLGKLDETIANLRAFADEVEATHGAASSIALESRELLGRVHFQAMIALRLESAEEAVWKKQWELARQNYRFLAEHSPRIRNAVDRKNLEVVIKSADLPPDAFPPPPAGGGGGGGGNPPTVPPPPTAADPTTITTAPPDNRPRQPKPSLSELPPPPEFELGS